MSVTILLRYPIPILYLYSRLSAQDIRENVRFLKRKNIPDLLSDEKEVKILENIEFS